MTPGAQQALRRTMEIYSNTTRFCFACNQSNKIIEPLQSRYVDSPSPSSSYESGLTVLLLRCAILRYTRLSNAELLKRLMEICEAEQVKYNDEGLEALLFTSEGDMRQAINNLQSTWSGFGFISRDAVFKVCDQPHPTVVQEMLVACYHANITLAMDRLDGLWKQGYAAVDIVSTIFRVAKTLPELPEYMKLEFIRVGRFSWLLAFPKT